MSNAKITLYDIHTDFPGGTFSPYVFRVKVILKLKGIPYELSQIKASQVEATAKSVGAPPTKKKFDGSGWYTVPFFTYKEEGQEPIALSDSAVIASFLEEKYPNPGHTLFPASDRVLHSLFSNFLNEKLNPVLPVINMKYIVKAMPEEEIKWFGESRKAILGRELAPPTDGQRVEALKAFEAFFEGLSAHLDKAGEGNNRVSGGAVTFAEIELVGYLSTLKVQNGDAWEILKTKYGGRFAQLLELPEYKLL